jgi:hypothetical protein
MPQRLPRLRINPYLFTRLRHYFPFDFARMKRCCFGVSFFPRTLPSRRIFFAFAGLGPAFGRLEAKAEVRTNTGTLARRQWLARERIERCTSERLQRRPTRPPAQPTQERLTQPALLIAEQVLPLEVCPQPTPQPIPQRVLSQEV